MNFRDLINKIDIINETDNLNSIIAGSEQNEPERIKKLSAAAASLNVSGLYDPISGKFVSKTGDVEDTGTNAQNLEIAKLGLMPQNANLGSPGWFDNSEVKQKTNQSFLDLSKSQSDRASNQQSNIDKIKGMIDQYEQLKKTIISESISKELVESFGYEYNELLQEYDFTDFKQDAADVGRGVASGATLGYAPEIAAQIRSRIGDISYEDALKQEKAKNDAAKKRSPWLYNAGMIAPGAVIRGPLGAGMVAADMFYGKDKFANPWDDEQSTSTDTAPDSTSQPVSSTDQSQQQEITDQTTADTTTIVQSTLKDNGFDIGSTGVDGKFGPKTVEALHQLRNKYNLDNDATAIAEILGIAETPEPTPENMSEAEQFALLRNKLQKLDEANKYATALKYLQRGSKVKGGTKVANTTGKVSNIAGKIAGKVGSAGKFLGKAIPKIIGPAAK